MEPTSTSSRAGSFTHNALMYGPTGTVVALLLLMVLATTNTWYLVLRSGGFLTAERRERNGSLQTHSGVPRTRCLRRYPDQEWDEEINSDGRAQ